MNVPIPSAGGSMLVLAVHPDDESLGAGGLIQLAVARGAEVRVVVVTAGDNNPWPQRFVERRWRIDAAARRRWGQRRCDEARAALAVLGVRAENVFFWHYADQGLTRLLLDGGDGFIARVREAIERWKPDLLVAPSARDLHPDHSACAVMLDFALAGRTRLPDCRVLEYLVHSRGTPPSRGAFEIELSPEQLQRKRRAILCHATQMALSRERFLAFAQPTETFLLPAPAAGTHSSHPIASAELAADGLRVRIGRTPRRARLLVAAEMPAGAVRRTLQLPERRNGRSREPLELTVPIADAGAARKLYVKLAAGGGFFDRAGWRRVALPVDPPFAPPRVCCVIPCYNLEAICGPVVREAAGFVDKVIAVNDGSDDRTGEVLSAVAAESGGRVEVLSFGANRGKGAALLQAFRRASEAPGFDIVVTLDGDGQHRPEDIPRLVRAMVDGEHALVIGERLARAQMPLRSRVGNTLTSIVMKLLHPAAPTDTQSGFRAFDRDFVREVVTTLEGGRYETELKILLLALHRGHRIGSVTIPTVYLERNRLSHFRPIRDSWRIYSTLVRWQFNAPAPPGVTKRLRLPAQ